jgi:hypothetical protein
MHININQDLGCPAVPFYEPQRKKHCHVQATVSQSILSLNGRDTPGGKGFKNWKQYLGQYASNR